MFKIKNDQLQLSFDDINVNIDYRPAKVLNFPRIQNLLTQCFSKYWGESWVGYAVKKKKAINDVIDEDKELVTWFTDIIK